MPFDSEFDDVYQIIRQSCNDANVTCKRLDDNRASGQIMEDLYHELNNSQIFIADITRLKPNVLWEMGYIRALNKPTLLISQEKGKNLPFDIKDARIIFYDRGSLIKTLKGELTKAIEDTIAKFQTNERKIIAVSHEQTTLLPVCEFFITNKAHNATLDCFGPEGEKPLNLHGWKQFHYHANQLWLIHKVTPTTVIILSKETGYCLSTYFDDKRWLIHLEDYSGEKTQQWIITRLDDYSFKIQSALNRYCLDGWYGGEGNEVFLQLWTPHEENNQRWWINPYLTETPGSY